jgi:hypothetical protein
MRPRLFALVLLVSFAPAALPVPVWAQTAADEANRDLARARFKEGVAYFDKGQFEQARAAFLQAYSLRKHPAILVNLAWSCLRTSHFLEAHRYFKQFLSEGRDITAAQRADVSDGLNQTDARLGQIEITATKGADVSVDGDVVGPAPLSEPVTVDVGAHTIKVLAPDGGSSTQSVTVLASERKVVHFALTAPATTSAPMKEPAPAPTSPTTSEPAAAQPTPSEPAPTSEAPEAHRSSFVPVNMVPVYIGSGLVLVSAAVAIGAGIAKQGANTQAALIKAAHDTCPAPSTATIGQIGACTTYANDNSNWNQDSTAANVAIGIGVAAAVGTVIYWIVAKKRGSPGTEATAAMGTDIVPVVGPSFGGLSVSSPF